METTEGLGLGSVKLDKIKKSVLLKYLRVHLNTGGVMEAIFHALTPGHFKTINEILYEVYEGDEPEWSESTVIRLIYELRKRGVRIISRKTRGYMRLTDAHRDSPLALWDDRTPNTGETKNSGDTKVRNWNSHAYEDVSPGRRVHSAYRDIDVPSPSCKRTNPLGSTDTRPVTGG